MMQSIRLARLEGFFHVARTGGYARAARAFPYPITEPAVHQQVRKLEADLGARLFTRAAKDRMALTPEGRALYEFARPFFEGLPAALRTIRERTFGGTLAIHAGGLLVRKLLPAWLRRLRASRPDIAVELHEAEEPAIPLLRAGQTDLVVDFLPEIPPDVVAKRIATTYAFVVVPADRAAAARKRAPLRELGGETFISYPRGSTACELQTSLLGMHGILPPRTLSAGSADAILGFVEAAVGWSIIPWLDPAGPKGPHLVARPLGAPRGGFPVHVAFRRSDSASPLIAAALEAIGPG